MTASVGGLDLLVLTGGMGEHGPQVRSLVARGAGHLGAYIDEALNIETTADCDISAPDAQVRTVVVTASEATEIARETRQVIHNSATQSPQGGAPGGPW